MVAGAFPAMWEWVGVGDFRKKLSGIFHIFFMKCPKDLFSCLIVSVRGTETLLPILGFGGNVRKLLYVNMNILI